MDIYQDTRPVHGEPLEETVEVCLLIDQIHIPCFLEEDRCPTPGTEWQRWHWLLFIVVTKIPDASNLKKEGFAVNPSFRKHSTLWRHSLPAAAGDRWSHPQPGGGG